MSSPHFRPPILSPAIEAKLKRQLTPLWEEGLTGPEISKALKFGEGEYENLETYHVRARTGPFHGVGGGLL